MNFILKNNPNNQIKVCHVTTVDLSLFQLLLNQLKFLKECGLDVSGVSSKGPYVQILENDGIKHFHILMSRKFTPFHDLISLLDLYRLFKKEKFTIVHTHNPKPGLIGQIAAKLANVPVIVNTVHGFYFHDYMKPWARNFYILMEKIAAKCSDKILSQNKDDLEFAINSNICKSSKIELLGNGIDLSIFDPNRVPLDEVGDYKKKLGINSDDFVIGFVGRLTVRKGFDLLVKASQQVIALNPKIKFLIAGEKDEGRSDALSEDLVEELNVQNNFIFLGQVKTHELPLVYASMNSLVLDSPFEGIPRVLMEATSMGVPIIASNVKGNREVVQDGINGLLIPFNDIQALVDAIMKLSRDKKLCTQLGENGSKIGKLKFDEKKIFEKVRATYHELLRSKDLIEEEYEVVKSVENYS